MKRSSFFVKLGRVIQKLPLFRFRFIERYFLKEKRDESHPIPAIIIFALPRSGSTVTYQTICHGFQVNYLSNIWNLFFQLPLFGGLLSFYISRFHKSDFLSNYGFVGGLDGPAEGMKFWQWWLDCGLRDEDCNILPPKLRLERSSYLRKVLISLYSSTNMPFVTAYLGHILLPDRVYNTFHEAVFIRLKREPALNALSLLKSIRDSGSDWFSVRPNECSDLINRDAYQRVASQVYWLNRRLDDADCADSMFTVEYEKLCEDPEKQIERFLDWCTDRGLKICRKHAMPASLMIKNPEPEDNYDLNKIRAELKKLEMNHGKLK